MAKPSTIASAAPQAAADDTPSVNGLASGLLRMVCISAPAAASAMPTNTAMIAGGSRACHTTVRASGVAASGSNSARSASPAVSDDGPTAISARNAATATTPSNASTTRRRRRLAR